MRVINPTKVTRRSTEPALRRDGFVPLLPRDAAASWLAEMLPECAVEARVRGVKHGKLVWAHPGPSGLDPRALAPLSLVLMADRGWDLVDAIRWLLTEDVGPWLAEPTHRVHLHGEGRECIAESDVRGGVHCVTHPKRDSVLQHVADALGDGSYDACMLRRTSTEDGSWQGLQTSLGSAPQPDVRRLALSVTHRYASWVARGYNGSLAWDLARHRVTRKSLQLWLEAGFSSSDIATYLSADRIDHRPLRRDPDPVLLHLAPEPINDARDRGVHWYARWKLAGTGSLILCRACGAQDFSSPCRTCRVDGGPAGRVEWERYEALLAQHPTAGEARAVEPVPCGVPSCRTFLAASGPSPKGAAQ